MSYKRLLILVEGRDDADFIQTIIQPYLEKIYDHVQTKEYAREPNGKIEALIRSYKSMRAEYWFLCDLDNTPCFTKQKDGIKNKYPFVDTNAILIAQKEIEGWYIAGISRETAKQLGIPYTSDTSLYTKEQFNKFIPPSAISRKSFMLDLLKTFSIEEAKARNNSFYYCLAKLLPPSSPE